MTDAATCTWDDFLRLDLRIGTIVAAESFPEARKPAYKLMIDFGDDVGIKRSSAQITELYTAAELLGRQVLAVVNFPPKRIGPLSSEVLVTGVVTNTGVALVGPDRKVPNGTKLA